MKLTSIYSLFAVFIAASILSNAQAPKYNVTFLPAVGLEYVTVSSLNNLGEVVGSYGISTGSQAFYYSNGKMKDLKVFGGTQSMATAINDNSQIIGWSALNDTSVRNGFLYSDKKAIELGPLYAAALNDAGQVVGQNVTGDSINAFLWWNEDLDKIYSYIGTRGYIEFNSINDNYGPNGIGQIVGATYTSTSSDYVQAFLYTNGSMTIISDICPKNSIQSKAISINNLGQIVGSCYSTTSVTFVYNSNTGTYYLVGETPYCQVSDINNAGQIIGIENAYKSDQYPFLFMNNVEYNLSSLIPPDVLSTSFVPVAINDKGQIIATTTQGAPILLTPE